MFRLKRFARALPMLLVLVIAVAPVLPAFGMAWVGDAAHSQHDGMQQHAEHPGHAPEGTTSSCLQHDSCHGQCCSACAQCFMAAISVAPVSNPSFPIQIPAKQQLHSFLMIAAHNRPPQTAF